MFILQFYAHISVSVNVYLIKLFFLFLIADVMPYYKADVMPWADVTANLLWKMLNHLGRCYCPYYIKWLMLLPLFSEVVGRPLHGLLLHMKMAVLLPSGKMEQPLYIVLEDGRCYCQVAYGINRVGDGAW